MFVCGFGTVREGVGSAVGDGVGDGVGLGVAAKVLWPIRLYSHGPCSHGLCSYDLW